MSQEPRRFELVNTREILELEAETAILVRALEGYARRHDLHAPLDRAGYILLRALAGLGSVSVNSLAAALGLEASTVTRQAAVLYQDGLLDRQVDPMDRRSSILRLTEAGGQVMRAVRERRNAALCELTAGWTQEELSRFARSLTRFNNSIAAELGGTLGAGFRASVAEPV